MYYLLASLQKNIFSFQQIYFCLNKIKQHEYNNNQYQGLGILKIKQDLLCGPSAVSCVGPEHQSQTDDGGWCRCHTEILYKKKITPPLSNQLFTH